MAKVLSQAGISLADVYDVEGSIAGTDELRSEEVSLVHELGGQIFSERLLSQMLRMGSGLIAQNSSWDVVSGPMPDSPNRILGLTVFIPRAQAGDVNSCMLAIQDPVLERDIPFYTWDGLVDPEVRVRWNDDGGGLLDELQLRSSAPSLLPQLITRIDNRGGVMPVIRFRGETSGFGAGTVTVAVIVHLARATPAVPQPGQPSSHGLPLPSW